MKKYILKRLIASNLLLGTRAFANINYTTQVIPLESFIINSETNGKVKNINFNELNYVKNGVIIIDNEYETNKLNNLVETLDNLKKTRELKERNYKDYSKLTSIAQTNKDDKLIDLLNLKSNILQLENNIIDLKDIIKKKNIQIEDDYYVKEILIKENEIVKNGQEIVKIENHNKNKLIFFINKNDIEYIKNNNFVINIDGENLNNKDIDFDLDNSTDSTYITSYKLIVTFDKKIFDNPTFGSLATLKIIKQ